MLVGDAAFRFDVAVSHSTVPPRCSLNLARSTAWQADVLDGGRVPEIVGRATVDEGARVSAQDGSTGGLQHRVAAQWSRGPLSCGWCGAQCSCVMITNTSQANGGGVSVRRGSRLVLNGPSHFGPPPSPPRAGEGGGLMQRPTQWSMCR